MSLSGPRPVASGEGGPKDAEKELCKGKKSHEIDL